MNKNKMEELTFPITKLNYKIIDKYMKLMAGEKIIVEYPYTDNTNITIDPVSFQKTFIYIKQNYPLFELNLKNIPFCVLPEYDHLITNQEHKNKVHVKQCGECKYKNRCGGLWKNQPTDQLKTIYDKPNEIVIEVTSKCNKRCDYCFNSFSKNEVEDQPTEKIKEYIDIVKQNKIKNIRFTGGEALIRKDLPELLKYAKSKHLTVRLNTNGLLLTKEKLNEIEDYVDYILISLNEIDNTEQLKRIGMLCRSNISTVIVGTIAFPKNIEILEKFYSLLNRLSIQGWELYRPIGTTQLTQEESKTLVNKLLKLKAKFPIANPFPFCSYNKSKASIVSLGAKYDEGHSRLVIDPKGYVKPSYVIDKNLGDPEDILECWNHKFVKDIRELNLIPDYCKDCNYLNHCKGGSRFSAKKTYNSYSAIDPMMKFKLDHLVIKPTTKCPKTCKGCKDRQQLYKTTEELLTLGEWKEIIVNAKHTGLKKITISGGEPTLYKDLVPLIEFCKKQKITTLLNTTGLSIKALISQLNNSKLDAITFSLESLKNETEKKIRNYEFPDLKTILPKLKMQKNINTIITKHNYKELPEILNFCKKHKVSEWLISYPEYDFEKRQLLLSKENIEDFKLNIQPKLPIKINFKDQYENGIYNPEQCKVPSSFALILPNGDVHPCNIVEYTHEPIVGNVTKKAFEEIWHGKKFQTFRAKKHSKCNLCPVSLRNKIIISEI